MAIHALLTVDLNATSTAARDTFYQYLLDRQWYRLKLTTTFRAKFKESVSEANALAGVKSDIAGAAQASGVTNYEVAVQLGTSPLEQWKKP